MILNGNVINIMDEMVRDAIEPYTTTYSQGSQKNGGEKMRCCDVSTVRFRSECNYA